MSEESEEHGAARAAHTPMDDSAVLEESDSEEYVSQIPSGNNLNVSFEALHCL